jgi:hypothetical protein
MLHSFSDHRDALFDSEKPSFTVIDQNCDYYLIKQATSALDDIKVPISDGIK